MPGQRFAFTLSEWAPLQRSLRIIRYARYLFEIVLTSLIRWPDSTLKSRLEALAVAHRRSLHAEVLVALEQYVKSSETDAAVAALAEEARESLARVESYSLERPFKPDFKKPPK